MAPHVARQMQVTGALARHWNAVDVQGADDAPFPAGGKLAAVRGPGGAPLQSVPGMRPARTGLGQHASGVVSFYLRTSHGRGV